MPTQPNKSRYLVHDLDKFLAAYPDHSGTMLYVYRIWPAIRREPSYIAKVPPPFPVSLEEWTQTEWGGGRYRICFTDSNHKPTGQVCDTIFDVDHLQYEPNLEYLELADPNDVTEKDLSKRQVAYIEHLRRNGKLPPESRFFQAAPAPGAPAAATRTPGQDAAVKDVLDFAREVIDSKKPGDIEGYAQQKVVDSLAGGFSRIIELSQKMQPAADSAGTTAVFTTLTTLVQMMQTQILEQNKQIAALTAAPRQNPAPLESFEMIDKIAGTLDKLRGNGGGGGNWWDSIAAALAPALPPLISLLMQRNTAPPAMPQQQPGIGPAPAALPAAMPQQQPTGPPPDFLQMLGTTILNNMQQGFEGDDLAHSICVQQGNVIYLQLAGLGVEGLMSALKSVPVWQALQAAEPQVREFIEQFIRYKDEGGNPSEEVPTATITINGPAAGSARPSASAVQPPATGNQR